MKIEKVSSGDEIAVYRITYTDNTTDENGIYSVGDTDESYYIKVNDKYVRYYRDPISEETDANYVDDSELDPRAKNMTYEIHIEYFTNENLIPSEDYFDELEEILIEADIGVKIVMEIIEETKKEVIPEQCTAVGIPAKVVKKQGVRVENDLDQIHIPDPVAQEIRRLEEKLASLEEELRQLKATKKK